MSATTSYNTSPLLPKAFFLPVTRTSSLNRRVAVCEGEMSRNGKSARMDLRLNLTVRRGGTTAGRAAERSPRRSSTSSESSSERSSAAASSPSSCVSSEEEEGGSPEATSMVLAGCPRCLMYVMLSEDDPKCPKCQSTVLLDFLNHTKPSSARTTRNN